MVVIAALPSNSVPADLTWYGIAAESAVITQWKTA
jgi:hypothetical protein